MNWLLKNIVIILLLLFFIYSLYADYNVYPPDSNYHNEKKLLRTINRMISSYPSQIKSEILGVTETDQKEIYLLTIQKDLKKAYRDKPNILVIGQIHSEEPIGLEISLKWSEYLLENKKNKLLDYYNFFIIPTLNPEGFSIVSQGLSNYHRKNKKDTNQNGVFDIILDGVDLNRNFPVNWNVEENNNPENRYYAGDYPASEAETRILMSFFERKHIFITISYHSSFNGTYNEKIFFPYNWEEKKSPHYEIMNDIALKLAKHLPVDYQIDEPGNQNYQVHTQRTGKVGYLRDYVYKQHHSLSFDIEVGGINHNGQSVVFPPNKKLAEIINKNIKSLNLMLSDISKDIHKGLIVKAGQPLAFKEIIEDSHRKRKALKTNEFGYFFIYSPLNKNNFNIFYDCDINKDCRQTFIYNVKNKNTQIFHVKD